MSETLKIMSPVVKWAKWTGDNLIEIEEFWTDELMEWSNNDLDIVFSVDGITGNLMCNYPMTGWPNNISVGEWCRPSELTVSNIGMNETILTRRWIEVLSP